MVVERDLVRQARLVVGLSRAAAGRIHHLSRSQPHLNVSRESCLALPRVKTRRRIRDASLVLSTGHA
jgi:hypothetical protein